MDNERARLRWRCRRGMRELDAVLEQFVDGRYDALEPAEKAQLAEILELPDPVLAAYLLGRDRPENTDQARLIAAIAGSYRP